MNQKDIEKELDISNPTVTGILNRLEVKGLITGYRVVMMLVLKILK